MKFAKGDRIVVTDKYRGAGCNHGAIGYYGHVVKYKKREGSGSRLPWVPWVMVQLEGRIDGLPTEDHYTRRPFPLFEFEIEHAD